MGVKATQTENQRFRPIGPGWNDACLQVQTNTALFPLVIRMKSGTLKSVHVDPASAVGQ